MIHWILTMFMIIVSCGVLSAQEAIYMDRIEGPTPYNANRIRCMVSTNFIDVNMLLIDSNSHFIIFPYCFISSELIGRSLPSLHHRFNSIKPDQMISLQIIVICTDSIDLIFPTFCFAKIKNISLIRDTHFEEWNYPFNTYKLDPLSPSTLFNEQPIECSLFPSLYRKPTHLNNCYSWFPIDPYIYPQVVRRTIDGICISSNERAQIINAEENIADLDYYVYMTNSALVYSKSGSLLKVITRSKLSHTLISDSSCLLTSFAGDSVDYPMLDKNLPKCLVLPSGQEMDWPIIKWIKPINQLFIKQLTISEQYIYSCQLERVIIDRLISDNRSKPLNQFDFSKFYSPKWVIKHLNKFNGLSIRKASK